MLVSYTVKIDEAGVSRLHTLLDRNRRKAEDAAKALALAEKYNISPQTGDLPVSSVPGDPGREQRALGRLTKALSSGLALAFRAMPVTKQKTPETPTPLQFSTEGISAALDEANRLLNARRPVLKLYGDASGLLSVASNAASRVRGMFADISLGKAGATGLKLATGGRFTAPTHAEIAEDGDPEYVIPIKKLPLALPLIRRMLAELPLSATSYLGLGKTSPEPQTYPHLWEFSPPSRSFVGLPPSLVSRSGNNLPLSPILSNFRHSAAQKATVNRTVTVPCTFNIQATGTDPEALGRNLYNLAEHQLARRLQSVFDQEGV